VKTRRSLVRKLAGLCALTLAVYAMPLSASSDDASIVVASTTSTQDSGLFDYLLPIVNAKNRHHGQK